MSQDFNLAMDLREMGFAGDIRKVPDASNLQPFHLFGEKAACMSLSACVHLMPRFVCQIADGASISEPAMAATVCRLH